MKNKLLIVLLAVLFMITTACGCNNTEKNEKKDETKKQIVGKFEVTDESFENVDGTLNIKITLKNTSDKNQTVPKFYVSLTDKDDLKIADVESNVTEEVEPEKSTSFEMNTGIQYSSVDKIEYKEKEQEN